MGGERRALLVPTQWLDLYGWTLFDELGARAFCGLVYEANLTRTAIRHRYLEAFDL